MKHRTPILPLLALALCAAPALAADITINSLAELQAFIESTRNNDYAGDTIRLTADIDCQGGRFNTGDSEDYTTFAGTFDGQGHTISNFVHASAGGGDYGYGVAMFDFTETGATIQNLTLEGSLPGTVSGSYAAPFVLAAEGPFALQLYDCHFRGSVTNYYNAAGLVGFASPGEGLPDIPSVVISNCSVRGEIVSTWVYTAGGLVAKGTGVQAFDCSVESELHGGRTGGLVGEAYGGSFEGCSFEGTMRPDRSSVSSCLNGGLVGEASNTVFRACTSVVELLDSKAASAGGAAAVTFGNTAFYDCSATVEAAVPIGRFGGFVGWTAGAEVFSNCTASLTAIATPVFNPDTGRTNIYSLTTGGFAASVASDGALFVDCTASAGSGDLKAGFYYNQEPFSKNVTVGSNTFRRCHVVDSAASYAGFCSTAWNCTFEGCTVRGGTGGAGFVQSAGRRPDDSNSSTYAYEQTSTFTDCSVHGTRASSGFVMSANSGNKNGHTNVFRRCRAGCIYGNSNNSGAESVGFGSTLNKGTLVEDCAAYGIADMAHLEAGFAGSIGVGATVRRSVGAVYPRTTDTQGAGFADLIAYGTTVENCYAVYAPYANAVEPYSDQAYKYGVQGGFVRRTSIGTNEGDLPIVRCFALWPLSEPVSGQWISGSFCGVTPNSTSTNYFEDCYRPAEAAIGSCHNEDAAGVTAFTKAEFAGATAATMPNYDFADTWHAPGGVASSPYLDASVDENGDFWFFAGVIGAEGRILVNGEAPREAYPAGSVLTVQAIADNPDMPFAGWVGDGFADPSAQTTTYTVKNVSAIAAKFCTPIYTVDDWTNRVHATYISSDTTAYALMNDLDFTDYIASNGLNYISGYYSFSGKIFGQGHTIKGLDWTEVNVQSCGSLFNALSAGAEIRDLTVVSTVTATTGRMGNAAGLVASVGSGVLITNCHAVVDYKGVYSDWADNNAKNACEYYGLAASVAGTDIRIVDCSVEGTIAGMTKACGFVGSATLNGGEIARCAVYAEVAAQTNRTDGSAAGFAGSITLEGGAVVRECLSAGVVDAERDAFGFAGTIDFRDAASSFRDCYSTAEVVSHHPGYYNSYGIAQSISGYYEGNATIENVWFGGAVRGGKDNRAFALNVNYATLSNCHTVGGAASSGTDGVTALEPAAARQRASWTGFDFNNVWSMTEGSTTPYFAWSLTTNGAFRVLADEDPGTTIAHPYDALPGAEAAISAAAEDPDLFFCQWAGAAAYTNAAVNPSAILADNHRTVRAVWGKAITTRAELEAIAEDPAGTYALGCDIDLGGEPWTPLCQDEYTPFSGTLYGNGHTISNLIVDTDGAACAGLFGRLQNGATVVDLNLANPVVRGANCVGTLAGYVDGANIAGCTVVGADVTATSERAGCFVGQIYGAASSVSRCSVVGEIVGNDRYVGGFVGSAEGSVAIDRCCALGSVMGTGGEGGIGGFVGYANGDSVSFSECFACGTVTASGRDSVGGFAGYVGSSPAISDCYALADVRGGRYVGGFAGQLYYSDTAFARCYAAGSTVGSSESGGFAGRQYRGTPSFTDCFRPADGLPDLGTDSADLVGVDALDAAGFLDADNFASFHDTGKWTQVDGKTQPYFAWSLSDGKMALSGKPAGTGRGAVRFYDGDGNEGAAFAPGETVTLVAEPDGSVFLGWLGNAPYADRSDYATTMPLDNFRIVTAQFGKLIMNVADLHDVTNGLSGSYALGADIDLSDDAWTPIGTSSQPFTGSLYGQGHSISGLTFANTSSGDSAGAHAGLFRYAKDATFVGIVLEDVDLDGYQYVGALAGEVQGATMVRDCSASGTAKSSNGCVGMLVGRVYNANGTVFEDCEAAGEVVSAGASAGGLVGDIYNSTVSFDGCGTDVAVSGTGGNNKGGLVGYIEYGGSASFADCWTEGDVTAPSSQYVGGFVGNASRPVFCDNCQAFGAVSGSSYTGGFAGQASGEGSVFADCFVNGDVTATSSQIGGFVGTSGGARSVYDGCGAYGDVVSTSSETGGFVGLSSGAGTVFDACLALGATVRTTGAAAGGFVGKSSASNEFARCIAKPAVTGGNNSGGFVGSAEGGNSQYEDCEARGSVASTGYSVGGFAGQTTGAGTRYANCSAFGSAATTSNRAGGFVGYVSGANAFWRCFSAGSATASHEVGGFLGYNNGGGTTATECFALGDATATRTGNDAIAGGFIGYGYYGAGFTDCYCLGTVKGERVVGGFAGYLYDSGNTFTRCYAAGALECSGTWAGAFVGYPRNYGAITDCAALCTGDLHAFGTGTAGTSEAKENIAEYDAAGMKDSGNFDTWLAIDDADGAVWTQADGVTQPYLSWSSPDGDLMVYASVGGSASGRIDGAGIWYAPGDNATVTAIPDDGGFFAKWTGSTPYKSRTSVTTQIPMDNHRVAAALLGKLITTADELDAVRNDLSAIYGLGNDIDLAGRNWTPIGFNNAKFSGQFYGFGHAIRNMVCTNSPSSQYHGLFGWTEGATLDGVTVSGTVSSKAQYTGGLVGCANATTIRNCHADCTVSSTSYYTGGLVGAIGDGTDISGCSAAGTVTSTSSYTGGLSGGCGNGTFAVRDSVSTATVSGVQYTGGFIGYISCSGGEISGCRADGYAGGAGDVGGFVGYVSAPLTISDCVARGDVRSSGSNYGGFVGRLSSSSATIDGCWCSGAVWGTGGYVGAFVGYLNSGTIAADCAVAASANGGRAFNGRNVDQAGATLTDYDVSTNSIGWPEVEPRWKSATPISTAADLASITNGGVYRLTADIDLGGAAWTPLFQSSGFTGELYGQNHVVTNFVVDTTAQYAGLFGQISGGRVEGVQAFGSVKSTSSYVGGFAGKIGSYSHVKGCSFVGEVESSSTRVGGFVGGTGDWPTIHRCCAVGSVKKTGSTNYGYVGGFVGDLDSGPVADCYARGTVDADGSGYAGGFAGQINGNARVFTTYCSAPVTTTSTSYVGAFGGYVNGDRIVTNSYHHAVDARQARGQSGSSIAYVGIDPVATADMTEQASFPAFDFKETWLTEDEEGSATYPYLKCLYEFTIDSFERWARLRAGLTGNPKPEDVVNGIPLAARYIFDIYSMDAVLTEAGDPVMRVEFDENGEPYVQFAEHVYGTADEVTLEVLATPDVTDWDDPEVIPVDLDEGRAKPACLGGVPPAMFFKWRITVERAE